jgi:flagellar biogenesis protein FliO
MEIPAGEHTVEFRNEAPTFHKWETVELASSIFLAILIVVAIFLNFRKSSIQGHSARQSEPTK